MIGNEADIRVSSCKLFCICSILVIIHVIVKTFVPPKKEETALFKYIYFVQIKFKLYVILNIV